MIIEKVNILSIKQYGFQKGINTSDAMQELIFSIKKYLR